MSNPLQSVKNARFSWTEALRRLAVTLPFFLLATIVLAMLSDPYTPRGTQANRALGSPVLIITAEPLRPAFEALVDWNRDQGCLTYVIALERLGVPDPSEEELAYLSTLCALKGVSSVLLGGDALLAGGGAGVSPSGVAELQGPRRPHVVPVPVSEAQALPDGFRVGRAPVRTLGEAWEFVDACRAHGQTLDRLLDQPVTHTFFAANAGPHGPAARENGKRYGAPRPESR